MGPKFAVRDDSVNKHASHLETAESSMNAQAQAFLSAIQDLPADWKGASFTSWSALTQSWNDAMRDLNQALASIKSNVRGAGSLYDSYEAQQTEALASVQAGAGWDAARFSW